MKKRSLILVFLIVFPALLFAGGTKEEKAAPEPAQAAQKMTPIQKYNPGFQFPTEKIELSYWHSLQTRPGYHELALKLAEEYSAIHPNVSISVRDVPNAQQRAIWSAAFEGKSAPDVAWIEAQVGLMAKTLRKSPPWAVKMMEESFTPYALSLSKVGKDYFGWAGCEIDAGQMLYYRKDFFRQNGLDPEKPPEFLPDWLEAAKRLTKFDASGKMTVAGVAVRYAGGHMGVGDKFTKYAAAFVDTRKRFYYNEDFSDVILDDPGWIEAAQFYKDLVFKYKVTNTTLPVPITAFGQGLAAMTNRETFFAGWLKENAPTVEYGIAPLVNGKPPIGNFITGAIPWLALTSVCTDSKNPDIAWDFVMFMALPENEIRMAKNNGGISRHKAMVDDPYFKTLPYFETVRYMTTQRPIVINPYLDPNFLVAELEAKVGEAAVSLLTDPKADPAKLMKDMAAYGRQRLKESKSK